MILSPMRYKDYVWPHNPTVYEIEFKRKVACQKVPFGAYALQNMGRVNRVLRGHGEFAGPGAYNEFKKLATVFYGNTPGLLVHPVWQLGNAYFVELTLKQEPKEDYVSYAFEFWECYDEYETGTKLVTGDVQQTAASSGTKQTAQGQPGSYVLQAGDSLWRVAAKYGLTLAALLALNPQIKNPNQAAAGDSVRLQ